MWIYVKQKSFPNTFRVLSQLTVARVCFHSCLSLGWLCCCWMSCSRRAMDSVQGFHFSLLPTSVKRLSGRPLAPRLWTLDEVRKHNLVTECLLLMSDCKLHNNDQNRNDANNFVTFFVFRHGVRGSNHRSFSSTGHTDRQSPSSERSLLQTEPAQPYEPYCHSICLCCSDILSGELLLSVAWLLSETDRTLNVGIINGWTVHGCPACFHRDSEWICPSSQLVTVASTTPIPSNSFTPPTFPSFCSLPWSPTCMLSPRCFPHASVEISWLICLGHGL